jgi:hypothetical protein
MRIRPSLLAVLVACVAVSALSVVPARADYPIFYQQVSRSRTPAFPAS